MHEESLIGRELAGYRILKELGRGGMGVVYLAEELALQRKVALKVLAARLSGNTSFVARFLREARAIAKLDHPNIVRVHAVGEAQGLHFISMEYVPGNSLSDVIAERGALAADEAFAITRQIAQALVQAQKAGIIHRDIKPQNIMIDEGGRIRVMDFGLAKLLGSESNATEAGTVLGTPLYMAPEQIRGGKIDARADLFSLGILLYEMLSGHPPFDGDTPLEAMYKIAHDPMPPLDTATLGSLPELAEIVARLTAKEPERRCPSAAELLKDLDRIGDGGATPEVLLQNGKWPIRRVVPIFVLLVATTLAATLVPSKIRRADPDLPPGTVETVDLGGGVTLELVWIPPGTFIMGGEHNAAETAAKYGGDASDYALEHPRRTVTIESGFWMGKFEVTQGQFRQFRPEFELEVPPDVQVILRELGLQYADISHPVSNITWLEAVQFCEWMSDTTGDRYRLPTEAEWEYACRAGTDGDLYWEDDPSVIAAHANVYDQTLAKIPASERIPHLPVSVSDGYAIAAPVGSFKPNGWGLYDMIGNVFEWCSDWFGEYEVGRTTDPRGPRQGSQRVLRGGAWGTGAGHARSASRLGMEPEERNPAVGFRVLREP